MNDIMKGSGSTGLGFLLKAMASGGLGVGIGHTLGLTIEAVEDGRVVISGIPAAVHANPMGSVHGGYLATLLDGAMALAVQTRLDVGTRYATTDLNVAYVKAVSPGQGVIRSAAKVLHIGRIFALAEAKVTDDSGTLYAHATATFAVSERRP